MLNVCRCDEPWFPVEWVEWGDCRYALPWQRPQNLFRTVFLCRQPRSCDKDPLSWCCTELSSHRLVIVPKVYVTSVFWSADRASMHQQRGVSQELWTADWRKRWIRFDFYVMSSGWTFFYHVQPQLHRSPCRVSFEDFVIPCAVGHTRHTPDILLGMPYTVSVMQDRTTTPTPIAFTTWHSGVSTHY